MGKREVTKKGSDVTIELVGFPKTLLHQIRRCSRLASSAKKDIVYLWMNISKKNETHRNDNEHSTPTLEDWLNVVDECAGAGVKWVVLTVDAPLDEMDEAIEICKWAQSAYNMKVGIFLCRNSITKNELRVLNSLRKDLTQIFVKRDYFGNFTKIKENGFFLGIADPQKYGEKPNCEGAKKLLFVNPEGAIYTCGLVAGLEQYRLGDIHERKFSEIVHDPTLPHKVEKKIHKVNPCCDGCPSLLAKYLNNPSG